MRSISSAHRFGAEGRKARALGWPCARARRASWRSASCGPATRCPCAAARSTPSHSASPSTSLCAPAPRRRCPTRRPRAPLTGAARAGAQLPEQDELLWDDGTANPEYCLDQFPLVSKVTPSRRRVQPCPRPCTGASDAAWRGPAVGGAGLPDGRPGLLRVAGLRRQPEQPSRKVTLCARPWPQTGSLLWHPRSISQRLIQRAAAQVPKELPPETWEIYKTALTRT